MAFFDGSNDTGDDSFFDGSNLVLAAASFVGATASHSPGSMYASGGIDLDTGDSFFDGSNDAGSGAFFDGSNDADIEFIDVVLGPSIYNGPGSLAWDSNFEGVAVNGDIVRYPNIFGLVIYPDGSLSAAVNNLTCTYYYNDGSGFVARTLTINNVSYAHFAGATAIAEPGGMSASGGSGGTPGIATFAGDTKTVTPGAMQATPGATQATFGGSTAQATPPTNTGHGAAEATFGGNPNDTAIAVPGRVMGYSIPDVVYAKPADMIVRYGLKEIIDLTDKEDTGDINQAVLQSALANADAEIDGYLSSRYRLPLALPHPRNLVLHAMSIARKYLYDDRAPETVKEDYNNAMKYLSQVAKRQIDLGIATNDQPVVAPTVGGPQAAAPQRVFTDSSLSDFLH